MRPPVCGICGKDLEDLDHGGLVYFKKRESDLKWDERMSKPGMVGHPPYADWFCAEHFKQAEALSHLTIGDAKNQMKESTD